MIEYEDIRNHLQKYGWYIFFLVASVYYLRENVISPYITDRKKKKNYKEATAPERVAKLREHMLKVREDQQKQAQKKSQEAEERKLKKKAIGLKKSAVNSTDKKLVSASAEDKGKGKSLSRSSYNPLMPSSGSAGPSYRPARRSGAGSGGG